MKKVFIIIQIILIQSSFELNAQKEFHFLNQNEKSQKIKFKLINNLIVIPLEVNGRKLSFIFDTGVNKTILFNLSQNDSLGLNNIKKINLQGLGDGKSVEAFISKNNRIRIKNIINQNETIYVILKDKFDFSGRMGITINGIIGYSLFKNFIVKINYKSKIISFYNPRKFSYSKCKKCEILPLQFHRKKPYVNIKVQLDTIGNKNTNVKMLIDSGGSDAIWLFENSKKEIQTPKNFFKDILGEGLSGTIYGNRSRIPKISIGKFNILNPTVSFLDTLSSFNARKFKKRNGSIGGNILKRFKIWIDYPNKKITLKKNGSFEGDFNYNMSGLNVIYNGKILVKDYDYSMRRISFNEKNANGGDLTVSIASSIKYKFRPSYKINKVIPNSVSYNAGLRKGDILLKINNTYVHELELKEIINKFQEKNNKKIKMYIERNGTKMKFEFRLKEKI